MNQPSIVVRDATLEDLDAIVALDSARYGEITDAQTDDPTEMFRQRITNSPGWFFVGLVEGVIEGLVSMQPMQFDPEDFESWDKTTSYGTLAGTYDASSKVVYAVAMTVSPKGSGLNLTDLLIEEGIGRCIEQGKRVIYFASRMPTYHRFAHKYSAEEYYNLRVERAGKLVARDPQIRLYEERGMRRLRLVENGFVEDHESCGYSVLFELEVPA